MDEDDQQAAQIKILERKFWERVAACGAACPDLSPSSAAEFADSLLVEWRKRFLVKHG